MFRKLLQFELFYHRKQRSLLILCIVFLGYGLLIGSMGQAPANLNFNAPYQLAYYTSLMSLGAIFIVMFFAINAAIRDKEHNVESIIYSTAIQKHHFFLSRFLAIFFNGIVVFMPFIIGYIASIAFSDLDAERIASFSVLTYLVPWLIFVIPNIFICAVVLFSLSLLFKKNSVTYIGAVAMYLLYMMASFLLNSPLMAASTPPTPEGLFVGALLDPFGITAFFEQVTFWTPYQKNTELLSFSGLLFWNRLLWIGLATLVLIIVYKVFSFRQLNSKIKKESTIDSSTIGNSIYAPISVSITNAVQRFTFFKLIKNTLIGVFKSPAFMVLILMWVVFIGMDIHSRMFEGGAYNDSWYTSTNLLIDLIANQLPIFGIMLIVFFSGEIVWRTRSYNFNEIIDATPVKNATFFLANLASLLLLPILLIFSSILIAIAFQLVSGYYNFELDLYLSMFYYQGIPLYIYCILALFMQSILPNKYLAMAITVVIIFLFGMNSWIIGITHPMLRFAIFPSPSYSNMNGFSIVISAFTDFAYYWIAFSGILALISFKLLQRGTIASFRVKLTQLISNWNKKQAVGMAIMVILFCTAAIQVYYNVAIVGEYESRTTRLNSMETYERKYEPYKELERLFPVAINTKVDLFPNSNSYTMDAKFQMKNKNDKAIATVFINERAPLSKIEFDRGILLERDSIYGAYLFEFNPPIAPNEILEMTFSVVKKVKGYEDEKVIVKNGTYITFRDYMPKMGYNSTLEIQNKIERKKRNLPELVNDKVTESHIKSYSSTIGKVSFESTISTAEDQTAITSGKLIKEWKENGRNYYHYKETAPIMPTIAYFSAKYATKKERYKNIDITQYFHPKHNYNIEKIAESTKEALAYCTTNFGDYPFDYLRIAEIPSHWGFGGYAHPGLISMVEDRLYLIDISNNPKFDLVAKRTIHEVAHQWWGHALMPKNTPGASLFIEGFAKYTEAVVLEKMYGKGALWQLSETANYRYFFGHAYASLQEPPVYLEDEESYIAYGKNLTVMLALKDLIGETKLNSVLFSLITNYGSSSKTRVTSIDFLNELYKIIPEHRKLIDNWFKEVILYDLSVEKQSYTELDNGKYKVNVTVNAKRSKMLADGSTTDIAIDEPIRMAVFTKNANEITSDSEVLYYELRQINKEKTSFSFVVDAKPEFVAIDPYGTRIDENIYDNIKEVKLKD